MGRLELLMSKLKGSAILAESDAYRNVLTYYNSLKVAQESGDAKAGVIHRKMAVHYKRTGSNGNGNGKGNGDNPESAKKVKKAENVQKPAK